MWGRGRHLTYIHVAMTPFRLSYVCRLVAAVLLLLQLTSGVPTLDSTKSTAKVVIDPYPNTATVEQGTTLILVCRVVGVPSTTVLSYQWACPGGCDAGAVDPEWAARIQQGNILVVNVRTHVDDVGDYSCTVTGNNTQRVGTASYTLSVANGLSLLNEDGGLSVFFPRNSFVTNTTLTHTDTPRSEGGVVGNDHIVCYGGDPQAAQVTWHNSDGGELLECLDSRAAPCRDCGGRCQANGAVGQDGPVNGHTNIHMYTDSPAYMNQDLECRVSGGQSAFIGVYLKSQENPTLQPPSNATQGATFPAAVSVSWSQVSGATGYYVSYQRQDLGNPPVVTPQYVRILEGATTSVTLSGLEPGTTYKIRVWSTNGRTVSSEAKEMDVRTMEHAPSPPRMLTMIGEPTGSTVELNWLPPLHPNGAIHYEIEYEPAVTPGDPVNAGSSSSPYFTLSLPNEFLTYNVRVAAVNTRGRVESSVLPGLCQGRSREQGPEPPNRVSVVMTSNNTAVVSWSASQSRMCGVVIGNYSVRYQLTSVPSTCTCGYTTLNTSHTSIALAELIPNSEYNVSVAAIDSNGDMSAFSARIQFITTMASQENMSTAPAAVGAAVGGFIGGVLLTAVIASCVAIVVSYRSKKKTTEHDPDSKVCEADTLYVNIQRNPAYEITSLTT